MDKRFLEECLGNGLSLEAIGSAAGKHPSTVSYWLKKHGLEAVGHERHAPRGGLDREQIRPLVDEGLTIEQIARRLGVSHTTVRSWLKKHRLRTHFGRRRDQLKDGTTTGRPDVLAVCSRHGETRHVVVSNASEQRLRCIKCRAEAVGRHRRKVKEALISEAGGCCSICGYARHPAALQFHHLDPSAKSFGLGVRGITRSLEKLRKEAEKCVLLCANCHALVEVGVLSVQGPNR